MTSDAKIGLLLGLVFIFIIAFIINGLPNFKSEVDNNELTTTMVSLQNKQLGIGSGVADSEVLESPRVLDRVVTPERVVVEEPMVVEERTIEVSPSTSGNQEVRYTAALPGSSDDNSNANLLIEVPETTKTIEIVPPVQHQEVSVREVPTVEDNSLRRVSSDVVAQVEKPVQKVVAAKPVEYVVQEGDSLGSISKKIYGEELGNKKVNIDKIFAANKKTLKSADSIYVGQKLIIPSLGGESVKVSSVDDASGKSMFERVKQIGRRGFGLKKVEAEKVTKSVSTRKYVVKEGDNLWKIAHKELGDGSRFGEISKMNKAVLKNQDSIVVGMTLLLPKK